MTTRTRRLLPRAALLLLVATVVSGCDLLRLGLDPNRPDRPGPTPIVVPDPSGIVPQPTAGGPAVPIEATWFLTTIDGAAVPAKPPITLELRGGQASGSGGCNSFGGQYTIGGAGLRFGELASTLIGCLDNGVGAREGAYFAALRVIRTWSIVEGRLELADELGAVRLVFESQPVRDQ